MRLERPVGRPVALAWNRQPSTSASRRNAAVWRNKQKPSSTAGSWRKWRGLGKSLPGRTIRKALTHRLDRISSWRRAPGPSAAIPAPFAIKRRALWRPGQCSPCPSTLWRSDDSRPIAPCGKAPCTQSDLTRQRSCMFRLPLRAHLRPFQSPIERPCDASIASGTGAPGARPRAGCRAPPE
jgi:hypothetical protein